MDAFNFSGRVSAVQDPNALGLALAEALASGRSVINFAQSNPTKVCVGLPEPEVLAAFSRPGILAYDPDPRGLLSARAAVAAWYGKTGTSVDPQDFFLTASTSEAYGWLFKLLCDPGDTVLVPKPGYPLFEYLAGLENLESVPYRLEYLHPQGWQVDIDFFAAVLRNRKPKAVVLIHPNNPTGSYISTREREQIVRLCRKAGAALIVDEVFLPYAVEDEAPPSFAGETDVPCFVLNGLSKLLGLPQMKLGWIVLAGPRDFRIAAASRLEIIADTYLSVGACVLHAAPELLPRADAFAQGLRERLSGNMAMLRRVLEPEGSPYRVLRCSAGWTALVEVPRVASEEEIALGLLREEGVYVHPGYFFDFEREAYLAVSLLLPPDDFRDAATRLKSYLDRIVG
jgi:alanine-synthesizing transaminase